MLSFLLTVVADTIARTQPIADDTGDVDSTQTYITAAIIATFGILYYYRNDDDDEERRKRGTRRRRTRAEERVQRARLRNERSSIIIIVAFSSSPHCSSHFLPHLSSFLSLCSVMSSPAPVPVAAPAADAAPVRKSEGVPDRTRTFTLAQLKAYDGKRQ